MRVVLQAAIIVGGCSGNGAEAEFHQRVGIADGVGRAQDADAAAVGDLPALQEAVCRR